METVDYDNLSKSRFTDMQRADPVFKALVQTYVKVKLDRQNEYIAFAKDFLDIDNSVGLALDAIGKVVGQKRELANFIDQPYFGFQGARYAEAYDVGYWYSQNKSKLGALKIANDEQYRRLIKARIINNRTRCTRDDLLMIVNLLTGNDKSEILEVRHGVFQVKVSGDADGIASYFISKYRDRDTIFSIPLGYRMSVRYMDIDDGGGDWDISCAGASDFARFNNIVGEYGLHIDGEPEPRVVGDLGVLNLYINTNMSDRITSDFDGFFIITKVGGSSVKLKFVPVPEVEHSAEIDVESNVTLALNADGSYTVCLV